MSFPQNITDSITSSSSSSSTSTTTTISDSIPTNGPIPINESCPSEEVKEWAMVAFAIATTCCVFGSVINIVTIITIYKIREVFQQTIVPVILFCCVSDLMISLIWLPFRAAKFFALSRCEKGEQCELQWPLGEQFSTMPTDKKMSNNNHYGVFLQICFILQKRLYKKGN